MPFQKGKGTSREEQTSYTPEKGKILTDAIRNGVPYGKAIYLVRICESTIYDWLNYGLEDIRNKKESQFSEFWWNVKAAETEKLQAHLLAIETQSSGWQARAWLCSRRWPEIYGEHAYELEGLLKRINELEKKIADEKDVFKNDG